MRRAPPGLAGPLAAALALAALATLAACREAASAAAAPPPLPPLRLLPVLPHLRELSGRDAAGAAPPAELRDLAEVALGLAAGDARTVAQAERALLARPDAALALEPSLRSSEPSVRARAAWLLGRTGRAQCAFALLLALKDEGDAETALWLAHALACCGNDAGLPWLDAAMTRADTAERAGNLAIDALRRGGAEPGAAPTYAQLRAALATATARWCATGRGAIAPATPLDADAAAAVFARRLAATEGTALRPVDEARFVLVHSGALPLPLLRTTLRAAEPYLRTMALQVLAELGPVASGLADDILPLLADPLTAGYAMRALGELGSAAAVPHLRARLGSGDTETRAAAAHALGLLRDQCSAAVFAALYAAAGEPLDVRVMAAFARLCCGPDAGADAFLRERERAGDYHGPTLLHLRERLARLRP